MIRTIISASKIAICLALVVGLVAQGQIAVVTSDAPFDLRGVMVSPGTGVPYWPVLAGDVIKAGQSPVTITFPDGSVIILSPGSSGKVDMSSGTPVFELDSGTAHYSLKKPGAVILRTGKDVASVRDLVGDISIGNGRKPPAGWWTTGRTTLVVAGAAGAAALGAAIVTQGTASPSAP